MEESKICKICNRSFSNGKALGGHLRSHFLKHPLPKNDKPLRAVSSSPPPPPTTAFNHNNNNNNNHQKLRVKTPTPTTLPSRKRSERRRNSPPLPDISAEEAAWFLIHLSRDTWHGRPKQEEPEPEPEPEEEQGNSNSNVYDNDNIDDIDKKKKKMVLGYDTVDSKKRVYSCKYCRKVFKSGQALGGHKKAHLSTTVPRNVRPGTLFLDLNLPPSLYISSSTCTYNVS